MKYNTITVREYSEIKIHDLHGKNAVVWTHPDIPMYGAELTVNPDGSFEVGKTLSKSDIEGSL